MNSPVAGATAALLLYKLKESHSPEYWRTHDYISTYILIDMRLCVCETCVEEMRVIAEQWEVELDAMDDDLRKQGLKFLGFDIWEEWMRKVS